MKLLNLKFEVLSPCHSRDIATFTQNIKTEPHTYDFSISYTYMGIYFFSNSNKKY